MIELLDSNGFMTILMICLNSYVIFRCGNGNIVVGLDFYTLIELSLLCLV